LTSATEAVPEAIADGIYLLTEVVNAQRLAVPVVIGARGVVVVDTGVAQTPARLLLPGLSALGVAPRDVRFVVITHSDADHSGGLGALANECPAASVIAHRLDVPWIEDVERLIDERYRGRRHDHDIDQPDDFVRWVRESDSGGVVHEAVVGGERLRIDRSRELELVHVPGHSRGHLAVVDWETRTGLIGDAVFGAATPDSSGSPAGAPGYYDVRAYRGSVERLAELRLARMAAAHYPVVDGDEAVQDFLRESAAFCDRLERAILDALGATANAQTTAEIAAGVAPRVRTWPDEDDDSLVVPTLAHLNDLRDRGLADMTSDRPVRWRPTSR
jgi:glyoxylase-like metal-dependent hydrolase (beta-lactamase superfamily II)